MKSYSKEIIQDFVSLFYPRYCYACDEGLARGEETICTRCMLDLPRTNYHQIPENPLFRRLNGRIPLRHAMAFFLFRKGGKVQHLLHALKYSNHPEIAETLGEVYGQELAEAAFDRQFDAIVPVPLHASRKRKRGYNQSEEFGRGLAKRLQVKMVNAITREVKTETQTRKTKLKRLQNVSEVFHINDPQQIYSKHILLVDDVITTGATIEACANTLLQANCASISIASIAYAAEVK